MVLTKRLDVAYHISLTLPVYRLIYSHAHDYYGMTYYVKKSAENILIFKLLFGVCVTFGSYS